MTTRPTACPCGGIMLADTEDWDVPRCFECWVALGEPKYEPKAHYGAPIPMHLWCPVCHAQHFDDGEFATRSHRTHTCQNCGLHWQPALVPTCGVRFLPGCKNEPTRAREHISGGDGEIKSVAGSSAAGPTGESEVPR